MIFGLDLTSLRKEVDITKPYSYFLVLEMGESERGTGEVAQVKAFRYNYHNSKWNSCIAQKSYTEKHQ